MKIEIMDYVILILLIGVVVFFIIALGLMMVSAYLIDEVIEAQKDIDNSYKD